MSRCGQSCQRTHSIGTSPLLMPGGHADILLFQQSFPAPVRYDMLETRVLHRRTEAEIYWHSNQFSTYPTGGPAAARCSPHSRPLAVKLWALTALHKQSHFYSSCTQLLSSCSITGPENRPVAIRRGCQRSLLVRYRTTTGKAYLSGAVSADCGRAMPRCRRSGSLRRRVNADRGFRVAQLF
jgi:hypothetical protein